MRQKIYTESKVPEMVVKIIGVSACKHIKYLLSLNGSLLGRCQDF